MGKKSRRRDKRDNKERGPPSAAEDHSDEYVVREIERSDPSYRLFPSVLEVDPELARVSRGTVPKSASASTGHFTRRSAWRVRSN